MPTGAEGRSFLWMNPYWTEMCSYEQEFKVAKHLSYANFMSVSSVQIKPNQYEYVFASIRLG